MMRKRIALLIALLLALIQPAGCAQERAHWEEEAAALLADADYEREEPAPDGVLALWRGADDPGRLALVSEAYGYQSAVRVLVRLEAGRVTRVDVLDEAETEDYGGYIRERWFLGRFEDMRAGMTLKLVKMAAQEQGDVVAVTGATISSQAVLDAVQTALSAAQDKEEGK